MKTQKEIIKEIKDENALWNNNQIGIIPHTDKLIKLFAELDEYEKIQTEGKTLGEEIEEFKQRYTAGDKITKWCLGNIAAAEYFKSEQIWKFIQSQPKITKDDAFSEK